MDIEIIVTLKSKVRPRLLFMLIDNIEAQKRRIYCIYVLTATQWVSGEDDDLFVECVSNCFRRFLRLSSVQNYIVERVHLKIRETTKKGHYDNNIC